WPGWQKSAIHDAYVNRRRKKMLQIINLWRFKRRRKKASVTVMPVRRDVTFSLPPDRIHDWTGEGVHYTMLENTMSLVIPVGERFFIDSVRYYRDQIQDAGLKQAVKAFIGQEAMHGREHRSEEHTSELQSRFELVCRLLLDNKNNSRLSTR